MRPCAQARSASTCSAITTDSGRVLANLNAADYLGALIGGFLSTELLGWGTVTGFNLRSFAIAILGAIVLLLIYRLFLGRRRS